MSADIEKYFMSIIALTDVVTAARKIELQRALDRFTAHTTTIEPLHKIMRNSINDAMCILEIAGYDISYPASSRHLAACMAAHDIVAAYVEKHQHDKFKTAADALKFTQLAIFIANYRPGTAAHPGLMVDFATGAIDVEGNRLAAAILAKQLPVISHAKRCDAIRLCELLTAKIPSQCHSPLAHLAMGYLTTLATPATGDKKATSGSNTTTAIPHWALSL